MAPDPGLRSTAVTNFTDGFDAATWWALVDVDVIPVFSLCHWEAWILRLIWETVNHKMWGRWHDILCRVARYARYSGLRQVRQFASGPQRCYNRGFFLQFRRLMGMNAVETTYNPMRAIPLSQLMSVPENMPVVEPRRKRFLNLNDLSHLPKPMWAIEGMFEKNSLVMLAGPPASYKSFLALSWLLCMAAGKDWCGRTTSPAKVLYVLGEGKSSLLKRVNAWMQYEQLTQTQKERLVENFIVSFEVPQMAVRMSLDNMLTELRLEGHEPHVIAIDTFARSFVGLDENSQKDTGLWIESAERLRHIGYTVIFLHHTKKNSEFGLQYRGSTAIMGAMDTAMVLEANKQKGTATLTVVKQKDHDEGDPIYFNRTIVQSLGDGEASVVLVPTIKMDERFTEVGIKHEDIMIKLMEDSTFESDRARARELSKLVGMSESAAQARISRKRKDERGEE